MLRDTRIHALCMVLLVLVVLASPGFARESERDLLATLQSDEASFFDKTIACKQLAVVGTEAAVPVLDALLDDDMLSHYARYGMEPIPSSKVDQAFLAALSTLKGRHLIGVINSIATRGKAAVIGALARKLDDADRTVAAAAAHSIGRLGTPKAGEILGDAMSAEFAAACLVCGKTLARQGHTAAAAALFVKLNEMKDAPKHIRLAAMLQTVDLHEGDGLERLALALASDDKAEFNTGLRTVRLLKGADATQAVLAALQGASPLHAAPLMRLMGDLADPSGLSVVVEAARTGDKTVRIAALEALAALGGADHVALLMDAALDKSEDVSAQAQKTLAALSSANIDRAVLGLLDDAPRRAMVIRQIGQRRITAAVPRLLALLDGPDRLDVIAALGETVSLDQLDVLGKLLDSDSAELRKAAHAAMHAACYRMPDRDATATGLAGYLNGASEETVRFVMDELRRIGGAKALAAVSRAAESGDARSKEYATQALGGWLDTSAAPTLIALARSEGSAKYGVRGIRGYIRLARQFSMPADDRAEMCRTALRTAERVAEKKLVLEVLERYPSVDTLKIAVDATRVPALKNEAARTALIIAGKIGTKSENVKKLVAKIGYDPVKVEILKAEYGAGTKFKDVTETLQKRVGGFSRIVLPSPDYNSSFGGDPVPGTRKELKVKYRIDGNAGEASFPENAMIVLPMPK